MKIEITAAGGEKLREGHNRIGAPVFPGTAWRFVRVGAHFGWGWLQAVLVLPGLNPASKAALVQSWCHRLLDMAGVTVEATGRPAAGPVMLVSNHVSWLDMVVIQSLRHSRFVAKSEVRTWPVIGAIATRLGTIYIDRRSARSAARVAGELAALLGAGEIVVIFPEGTTTDGSTLRPFQGGLLQAAINARASVQPAALKYLEHDTGMLCRRASYCGEDGLFESIWRTVSSPLTVRVAFGAPSCAGGQQRRGLAIALHSEVAALRVS